MKKCPYCGEEILDAAKKCKHCGEWLDKAAIETVPQTKSITCPVCSEEIDANLDICPFCHEPVAKPSKNITEQPPQSIQTQNDAAKSVFKTYLWDVLILHYADFKGSISRRTYWMYILLSNVVYCALFIVLFCLSPISALIFCGLWSLCLFIPMLAIAVRRLHDIGKSGWWLFICIAPLVGPIWLLVLLCKRGNTENSVVKWKISDTITAGVIGILLVVGVVFCLRKEDVSANDTEPHIVSTERAFDDEMDSAYDSNERVSAEDPNQLYYLFDGTDWEPTADGSLWLAVATTNKDDIESDRQGYIDHYGDLTIVAAETPIDKKVTPILSASQIANLLNEPETPDVFLSVTTSDDNPSLIYIHYQANGAEFGYSGKMNLLTGEVGFTPEEIY